MEEMEACLGGQKPDYVFQLEQYEKRALAYDAEIVAELEAMELQLKVGVGEDQLGRRFCCLFVCNECTEFDPEGLCLHCGLVGFRCADSCVRYARCGGGSVVLCLCNVSISFALQAHGRACPWGCVPVSRRARHQSRMGTGSQHQTSVLLWARRLSSSSKWRSEDFEPPPQLQLMERVLHVALSIGHWAFEGLRDCANVAKVRARSLMMVMASMGQGAYDTPTINMLSVCACRAS